MNVRRVLVECVKDHDWSSSPPALEGLVARQVPARLVAAAFAHRVAGCVYRSFSALAGTDDESLARLGAGYHWALAAHLRAIADIKAVGDALDDGGIPWLVVKGPVLADVYYPDPGLRTYFDLDLVVRPCDLRHAIEVLEAGGSSVVEQEWAATGRRLQVELKLILPNGSRGDLHWHLVTDESMRREVDLPMAEMFERARWTTVGPGVPARTLDAEDTLIHLALHGVASGGNRLVWLKDVEQAVLAEPEWGVVIDRARAAGAGLVVGTMLAQTRRILSAPVPRVVLRCLPAARSWSGLAHAAGLVSRFDTPNPRAPHSAVVRSARRTLVSSAGQLAYRTGRVPWRLARRRSPNAPELSTLEMLERRSEYCDAVERVA
jgi:Uncharacterised nucleotidyltransferase